jgi:hypothetical protein
MAQYSRLPFAESDLIFRLGRALICIARALSKFNAAISQCRDIIARHRDKWESLPAGLKCGPEIWSRLRKCRPSASRWILRARSISISGAGSRVMRAIDRGTAERNFRLLSLIAMIFISDKPRDAARCRAITRSALFLICRRDEYSFTASALLLVAVASVAA